MDIFVDLFYREVIVLELVENTNLLWQQSDNCENMASLRGSGLGLLGLY